MRFLRIAYFCFCFFIFRTVNGQELYFNTLEPLQDLPSTETYQIFQDSKGYIWISTDAGIGRYNGSKLQIFTTADGITENVVFNIYEDRLGRIWFTTLSGYFFYYENGKFIQISANNELKKICHSSPVFSFFIGEKDTLYFTNLSVDGLFKIPPQKNYNHIIQEKVPFQNVNRFLLQNKTSPLESVEGMGSGQRILSKDSYSLLCMNERMIVDVKKPLGLPVNACKGIYDRSGNVYLPCANILTVIRKKSGKIENYYFNQAICLIQEDKEGDLWIGAQRSGGYLFKNGNLESTPIRFLEPYSICDILLDREGSIWASTFEKGIFRCFSKKVLDIYMPNEKTIGFQLKNNQLLAGLYSSKLLTFSENKYGYSEKKIAVPSNYVLHSFYSTEFNNYYGTNIDLLYKGLGSASLINIREENHPLVPKKIIQLSQDTLLVASNSSVDVVYEKSILDRYPTPFRMGCIAKLKNDNILIGSKNNSGIFILKNKSLSPVFAIYPQLKTRINSIKEDDKGNLWIATNEKGLFRIDKNNQLFEYNDKQGLVSNKINSIDVDVSGAVWMATNRGLSKLTLNGFENFSISNFNKSHGLACLEIDELIAFDGKIWCGAKEHLFYFQIDQLHLNSTAPFTYLKPILINDKSYMSSMAPVLKYSENNINFEFENISHKNNKQKEYVYKLEGYDADWRHSNTGTVQYTNLPYGNYRFLVHALNNDKLKSIQPATFSFEIKKPFWLTWWFIAFEIIIISALVYIIAKVWVERVRKRESEKTLMHQKIAEFQMTAIRAQMNPHFLFNAMSSIQHYVLKNDPYESYNYLSKFSLLIRNVLDNSQEEYITIKKEIDTLRLYMELEQIRFELPFDFSIDIDEEIDVEDYCLPTMLIQPYIENAIWHGLMPKKTDCKLSLRLQKENNEMQIIITDNGIGRELSRKNKGNSNHISKGMSLSNQRLDALKIKNAQTFFVRVFDLNDENEGPAGTQVMITIPLIEF